MAAPTLTGIIANPDVVKKDLTDYLWEELGKIYHSSRDNPQLKKALTPIVGMADKATGGIEGRIKDTIEKRVGEEVDLYVDKFKQKKEWLVDKVESIPGYAWVKKAYDYVVGAGKSVFKYIYGVMKDGYALLSSVIGKKYLSGVESLLETIVGYVKKPVVFLDQWLGGIVMNRARKYALKKAQEEIKGFDVGKIVSEYVGGKVKSKYTGWKDRIGNIFSPLYESAAGLVKKVIPAF